MIKFLSIIKSKLTLLLGVALGAFWLLFKNEKSRRKEAERNQKTLEKKEEIRANQHEAIEENTANRDVRVEIANQAIDDSDSIDLNSL